MCADYKRRRHTHLSNSPPLTGIKTSSIIEETWKAKKNSADESNDECYQCKVQLWWKETSSEEATCNIMQDKTYNVVFDDFYSKSGLFAKQRTVCMKS